MLTSCEHHKYYQRLSAADRIMESHPDSAYRMLYTIDTTDISSDAERAYFGLLYSQARFKQNKPIKADLISRSIKYYNDNPDSSLLQRCYYYRVAINRENGLPYHLLIEDFKRAEDLIKSSEDTILALRIYDDLAIANIDNDVPDLSLKYARMELQTAYKTNDDSWIFSGLNNTEMAMLLNENLDSALFYLDKTRKLIPHVSKDLRAMAYNNLAYLYLQPPFRNVKKVEYYLKQALKNEKLESSVLMLARLYIDTGREHDVKKMLNEVLRTEDKGLRTVACEYLSQYYSEKEFSEKALSFHVLRDSIYDDMQSDIEKENVHELELKYDKAVEKNKREAIERDYTLIIILALLILLTSILIYTRILGNKNKELKQAFAKLDNMASEITNLRIVSDQTMKEKGKELKKIIKEKQEEIASLGNKLSLISDENSVYTKKLKAIRNGLSLLYDVMNNEHLAQMNKKDRTDLIECYRILDYTFLEHVETLDDDSLTVQEELFCILHRMNKDNETIKNILGLSNEAFRKTRSRTLHKLQAAPLLKKLADNLAHETS